VTNTIFWILISTFLNWCMCSIRSEMYLASFIVMLIGFNIMFLLCWDLGRDNIPKDKQNGK